MERVRQKGRFEIIGASLVALLISVIMILIFALVMRFVDVEGKFIVIINQIIKAVSLTIGIFSQFKTKGRGFYKGLCSGLLFAIICGIVLTILSGGVSLKHLSIDIGLLAIIGGLAGLIKAGK